MVRIISIVALIFLSSATKVSSQAACGQRNTPFWPWHVAIRHFNQDPDVPACGGTILNDLFIITAGHYEVKPICFTEEIDIIDANSVTIAIITKQSIVDNTVKWRITNYSLCHGTNHYIFNKSYNHSVCMGHVRATDKFQLHRGSALMVQQNHTWHLVGVLLYTIGPNENTATYGGGLVLAPYAKAITKIVNKHLTPRISNKKCEYYNRIAKENAKGYFSPYISMKRKSDEFVMPGCVGTLISETFVLTAAICTQNLERVILWKDILNTTHYNEFHVYFHPNDVYRQGVALVELDRTATYMEYFIHCLWTNDEDPLTFRTQSKHGALFLKFEANVQYRPEEAVIYRMEDCSPFTAFLICKPGDSLTIKKDNEKVSRIVGLITEQVEDCSPKTALNAVSYLDWIEETVWKNDVTK
ncbi:AAEL008501-PA [Aedes aegypti]|uniref:AAEL008501-PA n=1 Tax=Aedes aegypti TaxID=7159 RepID=Q16YL1_AEDAE|nr:AAEL008501-PA [Aedes aegypti]